MNPLDCDFDPAIDYSAAFARYKQTMTAQDWQPIDTAPADTRILVRENGYVYIAEREDDGSWWTDEQRFYRNGLDFPPTCSPSGWMPLPNP